MKKLILVIAICLFLIPFANASIIVSEESEKNIVLPGEGASFFIDVNNLGVKDSYGITLTDSNWRLKGKTSVDMESGQKQRVRIELFPVGTLKPSSYSVNLRVYSKTTGEAVDRALLVNLVAFEQLIDAQLEYNPQGLDPRKENLIRLNLKNKNNIPLDGLKISIDSSLFDDERNVRLLPLEARTEELKVVFKDFVEKGGYDVHVLITMNGKTLVDRTEKVNVGNYNDVTEDKVEENGLLVKKIKLIRQNNGNTASQEDFTVRLNSFEKTFTSMHPEPTESSKNNDVYYYIWKFSINPGDSYKIEVKTDYLTPLVVIVLLIIIGVVAYILLKKDVSIKKKVLTIKKGEGISEMKIILIVKNKGGGLKGLQVVDRLPRIVKRPTEYGIVKPVHVKTSELGDTLITWHLENLVKGEERVISYKIKSDVHVIGRLSIPVATVKYRAKSGNIVNVNSNKNIIIS